MVNTGILTLGGAGLRDCIELGDKGKFPSIISVSHENAAFNLNFKEGAHGFPTG